MNCARPTRASVLVIVMITLLFTAFALIAFIEKATNDLLVEQRAAETRRLRMEAYSALEVTLAVLENFREVTNGLHSSAEGWTDPLGFAGYLPTEDRTIDVAFDDESGKISLPRANAAVLSALFKAWQLQPVDADALADALLGWMKKNHVYTSSITPGYQQSAIPYEEPGRPLRSFQELAAIEKAREIFYDADGRPNDLWRRFADSVSLLDFAKTNLNGARPDTLAALGQFDATQQQNLADYRAGTGSYQSQGPGYFQNVADAQRIAGATGDAAAFSTTISALRITLTVHDGRSQFRLSAVIAPPNGATTITTTATSQRTAASASSGSAAAAQNQGNSANPAPAANSPNTAAASLRYPFTLLEIRENDEIPPPPSPPPAL